MLRIVAYREIDATLRLVPISTGAPGSRCDHARVCGRLVEARVASDGNEQARGIREGRDRYGRHPTDRAFGGRRRARMCSSDLAADTARSSVCGPGAHLLLDPFQAVDEAHYEWLVRRGGGIGTERGKDESPLMITQRHRDHHRTVSRVASYSRTSPPGGLFLDRASMSCFDR